MLFVLDLSACDTFGELLDEVLPVFGTEAAPEESVHFDFTPEKKLEVLHTIWLFRVVR